MTDSASQALDSLSEEEIRQLSAEELQQLITLAEQEQQKGGFPLLQKGGIPKPRPSAAIPPGGASDAARMLPNFLLGSIPGGGPLSPVGIASGAMNAAFNPALLSGENAMNLAGGGLNKLRQVPALANLLDRFPVLAGAPLGAAEGVATAAVGQGAEKMLGGNTPSAPLSLAAGSVAGGVPPLLMGATKRFARLTPKVVKDKLAEFTGRFTTDTDDAILDATGQRVKAAAPIGQQYEEVLGTKAQRELREASMGLTETREAADQFKNIKQRVRDINTRLLELGKERGNLGKGPSSTIDRQKLDAEYRTLQQEKLNAESTIKQSRLEELHNDFKSYGKLLRERSLTEKALVSKIDETYKTTGFDVEQLGQDGRAFLQEVAKESPQTFVWNLLGETLGGSKSKPGTVISAKMDALEKVFGANSPEIQAFRGEAARAFLANVSDPAKGRIVNFKQKIDNIGPEAINKLFGHERAYDNVKALAKLSEGSLKTYRDKEGGTNWMLRVSPAGIIYVAGQLTNNPGVATAGLVAGGAIFGFMGWKRVADLLVRTNSPISKFLLEGTGMKGGSMLNRAVQDFLFKNADRTGEVTPEIAAAVKSSGSE